MYMKIEKYILHLFQAEQDKNSTYTDKWGNTLTPHWWKQLLLL